MAKFWDICLIDWPLLDWISISASICFPNSLPNTFCPNCLCPSTVPETIFFLLLAASSLALTVPEITDKSTIFLDVIDIALARLIPSCLAFSISLDILYSVPPTTAIAATAATHGFASIGSNATIPCNPKTNGIIVWAISPNLPPAKDAAIVSPETAPIPRLAFELNSDNFCFVVFWASVDSFIAFVSLPSAAMRRLASFKLIFSTAANNWARDSLADCDTSPSVVLPVFGSTCGAFANPRSLRILWTTVSFGLSVVVLLSETFLLVVWTDAGFLSVFCPVNGIKLPFASTLYSPLALTATVSFWGCLPINLSKRSFIDLVILRTCLPPPRNSLCDLNLPSISPLITLFFVIFPPVISGLR